MRAGAPPVVRIRRGDRQAKEEGAAAGAAGLQIQRAAHRLGQLPAQVEVQSCAHPPAARPAAGEPTEAGGQRRAPPRPPRPQVTYPQRREVALAIPRCRHGAALGRVLGGVVQQVHGNLHNPLRIRRHRQILGPGHVDLLARVAAPDFGGRPPDQRRQRDMLVEGHQRIAVESGGHEQILHQAEPSRGRGGDMPDLPHV